MKTFENIDRTKIRSARLAVIDTEAALRKAKEDLARGSVLLRAAQVEHDSSARDSQAHIADTASRIAEDIAGGRDVHIDHETLSSGHSRRLRAAEHRFRTLEAAHATLNARHDNAARSVEEAKRGLMAAVQGFFQSASLALKNDLDEHLAAYRREVAFLKAIARLDIGIRPGTGTFIDKGVASAMRFDPLLEHHEQNFVGGADPFSVASSAMRRFVADLLEDPDTDFALSDSERRSPAGKILACD